MLGREVRLCYSSPMEENLSKMVIRTESWQFLAFIFGAFLVLVYGLIDELSSRSLRITLKIASFFIVGYFTLVNAWSRNLLVGLFDVFTREPH